MLDLSDDERAARLSLLVKEENFKKAKSDREYQTKRKDIETELCYFLREFDYRMSTYERSK